MGEEGRHGSSAGQVPTGQTVSGRRRGGVTYGFTATLPDLLGVRAGILSCLYPAMDQCVEYVYILSANFTQKRRGVGGRHKPFPPDDEAHPSKARARVSPSTGGFCRDRSKTVRRRHSTAPLGHATVPVPHGSLLWRRARGPLIRRDQVLS